VGYQKLPHRVTVEYIARPEAEIRTFATSEEARTFIEERARDPAAWHIFYTVYDDTGSKFSIRVSMYRAGGDGEWQR
jgi:hypothetical protein